MEQGTVQALGLLGSATVYEASDAATACDPVLRPMWRGARLAGSALPVRCARRDNLALHRAVALARPGDVLVADAGHDVAGYWGEVLTVAALARGISGLVIEGGVRDVDGMARLRFPVFAVAPGLFGTAKDDPGSVGEAVTVAGVRVEPGDVVVADSDGVVVVPSGIADQVAVAGQEREAKESQMMAQLVRGRTTLDLLGLSEPR